ncbi:MAG: hypothetical protein Q8N96_01045 [Methylovulum sp.]|nr:hypothetical protein [Methylovulum sp.]
MKNNNLTNSLFAVLLLSSPLVGADSKYPAADFQPQVVFQDSDYIEKNSRVEANTTSKPSVSNATESSEVDSKYPAANFQPQVVYSDANYKHNTASPTARSSIEKESVAVENSMAENEVKKAESTPNYLIGLIALALVGVFLLKNKFKCGAKKSENNAPTPSKSTYGLTGVARYLNRSSGTGVSRYLDKQVKSVVSATGVAKYVAKQALSAKATASEAATGVEKYMRNRG